MGQHHITCLWAWPVGLLAEVSEFPSTAKPPPLPTPTLCPSSCDFPWLFPSAQVMKDQLVRRGLHKTRMTKQGGQVPGEGLGWLAGTPKVNTSYQPHSASCLPPQITGF